MITRAANSVALSSRATHPPSGRVEPSPQVTRSGRVCIVSGGQTEQRSTLPARSRRQRTPAHDPPRGRVTSRQPKILILLAIVLITPLFSKTLFAQNIFDAREQSLVGGLRDRELFDLAESHCSNFLQRENLTPSDHASIAIERIRIKTAQARTAEDRESVWQAVDQVATTFFTSQDDNPKSVLVGLQQSLAHVSFASRMQQELEARIGDERQRTLGLQQLALARNSLDRTRQETINTLQAQANQTITADMLTSEQLRNLKTNLEYQQAVVNLTSAQLADASTEAGKLDRIDSLGRVPDQLASVRGAVAQSSELWWRTWIQEAVCRRMLGEHNKAKRILDSLGGNGRPKSVDAMLLREKVELSIAVGDSGQMQQLADDATKQRHDPETEVALIRLFVAAGDIDSASKLVSKVAISYGPWWARRSDIALLSGSDKSTSAGNAAVKSASSGLLFEAAENAEKNGDLDAAADGYLAVAESQFSEGDRSAGLATTVRAALVFEKQKQHSRAAEVLLKPARAYRNEESSPSIFLRGCWNLSRAESPQYVAELEAMIRTWPLSKSTDQARYWLSASQLSKKKYADTFKTLLGVQPGFQQTAAAISLARSAARRQLTATQSAGRPTRILAGRLNDDWSLFFDSRLKPNQPAVAIAMAELSLGWAAEDQAKTLQRMIGVDDLPAAKGNLEFQYLVALLDQQQSAARMAQAESLPFDGPTVERVLRLINRMKGSAQLGEIKLRIASDALSKIKVDDAKLKRRFHSAQASALVTLGRQGEAEAIYREMTKADPKNQTAIVELARLLDGEQALQAWRKVAARTAAHSKIWYESKLNIARLLHETGKSPEAVKMLKYIKAVPPGWEKSDFKPAFEKLLRECEP